VGFTESSSVFEFDIEHATNALTEPRFAARDIEKFEEALRREVKKSKKRGKYVDLAVDSVVLRERPPLWGSVR
jgi:hypothetical protein